MIIKEFTSEKVGNQTVNVIIFSNYTHPFLRILVLNVTVAYYTRGLNNMISCFDVFSGYIRHNILELWSNVIYMFRTCERWRSWHSTISCPGHLFTLARKAGCAFFFSSLPLAFKKVQLTKQILHLLLFKLIHINMVHISFCFTF